MEYRIAGIEDFIELSQMRWDFKTEGKDTLNFINKDIFMKECYKFFKSGLEEGSWTHWIALDNNMIVSHISINHIRKIPKPNRIIDEYGYVTNVYTKPSYRGKGIGSKLLDNLQACRTEQDLERLIEWASHEDVKG